MRDKLLAEWFWTDRWMGSSAFALPIDARGLYREMLTQAWRRHAQLPNNHDQIRRLTGVTLKEWRRTWPLVERFWRVDGESLVNDTQLEVYADALGRSRRASERARAGAQAKHKQYLSIAQDVLKHQPPISDRSTVPATEQQVQAPAEKALAPTRAFLKWFETEYPKRRNGAKYFVKWDKHSALIKRLLSLHSEARLRDHAVILLTTDEDWTTGTDRGIEILSAKINWLEDRLTGWEAKHGKREMDG